MREITLSVMRNTPQTETVLRQLLDGFEQQQGIRVHLQMLTWETARQDVKNFAIHQRGPDVSAMATTWIADLIAMNTLHPIVANVLFPTGKAEDFTAASWQAARDVKEQAVFAAPWLVDTYVIHYRADLLQQAGIDEATAFGSLTQIDETVRRLSEAGTAYPIQLPFHYDRFCAMHTLAAWVWGHGGEFCTPDGSRVLFDQPEAIRGMQAYFALARHLSPAAWQAMLNPESGSLFRQGQAAVAFGTLSFLHNRGQIDAALLENWRAAPLPEPHFVGGVNLVAWKYSLQDSACFELMRYLNSPEVVAPIAEVMLTSPARRSVLESPAYLQDPLLNVISRSARSGRTYFPVQLWGLIEDRFIDAMLAISSKLLASPTLDSYDLIPEVMLPVARRLNLTLAR